MPRVLQYIVHVDTIEVVGLTGLEKICWIWRSKVVFPFPDGPWNHHSLGPPFLQQIPHDSVVGHRRPVLQIVLPATSIIYRV